MHIRPLPSDSTTTDRSGLGDAEVRAADADLRGAGTSRGGRARAASASSRGSSEIDPVAIVRAEEVADLGAVPVNRGDEDVRRPVAVELEDQLGEVGLDRAARPPAASASFSPISSVVSDLTFTTSVTPCARATSSDDRVRLGGVARPVHVTARRVDRRLELQQVLVEPSA